MKRPAFQFYPADWRRDPELQSCSISARGLWLELICLMNECEPYGHLCVAGKPMSPTAIARLIGVSLKEYNRLLAELKAVGVPRFTPDGTLYSKRMVEDEKQRAGWRDRQGKSRASHDDVTTTVTGDVTPESPPSSTSSSSSSAVVKEKSISAVPALKRIPKNILNGHQNEFGEFWLAYPLRRGKGRAVAAYLKALEKTDAATILAAAKRYADLRKNEDATYTSHPTTWLNGECWTDDFSVPDDSNPELLRLLKLQAEQDESEVGQ